jgi:hypothetical protein
MGELIQTVTARGLEISFYEIGEGLIQMEVETGLGYRPTVKTMAVSGSEVWIKVGRKRVAHDGNVVRG